MFRWRDPQLQMSENSHKNLLWNILLKWSASIVSVFDFIYEFVYKLVIWLVIGLYIEPMSSVQVGYIIMGSWVGSVQVGVGSELV